MREADVQRSPAGVARVFGMLRGMHDGVDPAEVPGPPWSSDIDAVLWWHAASSRAPDALPAPLARRAHVPITLGGLVAYRHGPVGPYRELFASPVLLSGGRALAHVPFIAVDSPASVAGGRRNWALPKVAARFDSDPGGRGRVEVSGRDWALAVTITARPRRLPAWGVFSCAQVWPDGRVRRFTVRVRGSAAVGSVHVEALRASESTGWLHPGRHRALLLSGTQHVSEPRE
jgi:Acetoacetate decarboxylase (ADC)